MDLPETLQDYLATKDKELADIVRGLWRKSRPIHDCQNEPDSKNGFVHVKAVEQNIYKLLQHSILRNTANILDSFNAMELFLLSGAACCHDFDKALVGLPEDFEHGKGSGDFVVQNRDRLELSRPQAKAIQVVVSIHDLKASKFQEAIKSLSKKKSLGSVDYNLQRLAVLLKAGDILHCDNTRIPEIGSDAENKTGIARKKHLFREYTDGWGVYGERLVLQVDPETDEIEQAISECFTFMKEKEWFAVSEILEQYGLPYILDIDLPNYRPKKESKLRKYLKSVEAATQSINIQGLSSLPGATRAANRFPITEIYTPLKTHQPLAEFSPENAFAPRGDLNQEIKLTTLLEKHKRLLVVGDPGGGKTTFLKFVAYVLAKDKLADGNSRESEHYFKFLQKSPPRIPILLRLAILGKYVEENPSLLTPGATWRLFLLALKDIFGEDEGAELQRQLEKGECALLLDGLDEVAGEALRKNLVSMVNSILERWGNNLIIISSRPFGYGDIANLESMQTVKIDPFGKEDIKEFLGRWVNGLKQDEQEHNKDTYLDMLLQAIVNSERIRKLARNPVMLTCLCVVHWNERTLPQGKADLMSAILRWLLHAKEEKRKLRGYTTIFAAGCYKTLALAMTDHFDIDLQKSKKLVVVDLAWAADKLSGLFQDFFNISLQEKAREVGIRFLEEEMIDSGIIEQYGHGQLRFWHLTFQEYYAASSLVSLNDDVWWKRIEKKLYQHQWDEVVDHLAGCLAGIGLDKLHFLVEKILSTAEKKDLASMARMVGVLGRIMEILSAYEYSPPERLGWERARETVMEIFNPIGATKVAAGERIIAADALGRSGDSRIKVFDPKMAQVPGIETALLGVYPVTVMEFTCFLENDGYKEQDYWKEGWKIKKEEKWQEPDNWEEQKEYLNRPVTGVSYYEVLAYCNWLTEQTGKAYRLPKDVEWESAATHMEGSYPWGKEEPHAELLNFNNNVRHPTPIGIYPAGVSPGGHLDMMGNVWEWIDELQGSIRVLRGGGWFNYARGCRSASRFAGHPSFRYDYFGFRLARGQ